MVKRNNSILIITGRLIKEKSNIILNSEIIRKNFNFFNRKVYFQVPPMYSARAKKRP
ncbi:hypothetical protein [Candidatus Phytoplasma sacchari]|uniref:Single-stranded DNA-binding protein n=1 Tax=Candidatus Phytoplasma sacchari TaxID=2609813 RepID=A0ABY7M0N6_9MOLU|nr:hypothetical protein O7R10_01645 [Candidatus Phytoplasma sacchari]